MSRVYDNWERLVDAVLKKQHLREIALCQSFSSASSSSSADLSSRYSTFPTPLRDAASGTVEYISDHTSTSQKYEKKNQLHIVTLKIDMCCEGCELKVKKALSSLPGVKNLEIKRDEQKVIVVGYAKESEVLKKAKSTGKKADIWPYVPFNLVAQPYAPQPCENNTDYTTMFSDDNPNGCCIM